MPASATQRRMSVLAFMFWNHAVEFSEFLKRARFFRRDVTRIGSDIPEPMKKPKSLWLIQSELVLVRD